MNNIRMQSCNRAFSSGSLQTPEKESLFLEARGYYRKRIATNSTCLFRAVSEYEHGIQMYHDSTRAICVQFMRKNKHLFAKFVKGSFKAYLTKLALTGTYGSFLELRALAMFYRADVFIYEPFTTGRWIYQNMDGAEKVWRLFVCQGNQFDSVYPLEHMQEAAFCQSLVYEVLFKGVFQIPDVEYAVERMLYDPENITTTYGKDHQGRPIAITGDGRQLVMSKRDNTNCVLSNFQLCHFHNEENFQEVQRFFSIHGNDAGYHRYGISSEKFLPRNGRKPNPLLMERDISCVCQLLNIGVMPFPYKAAKALDTYMYRNVEFDVWRLTFMAKPWQMERAGDHTAPNYEPIPIQLDTCMWLEGMNHIHGSGNVQFAPPFAPFPDHTLQVGQFFGKCVKPEGQVQEEQSYNNGPDRIEVQYYDNVVNRQCQMDHDVPEVIQKPPQTAVVNTYWGPLNVNASMPLLLIPSTLIPYENWTPFAVPQRVSHGEAQLSEANTNESHLLQQHPLQEQLEYQQQHQQPHPQHGGQLLYFAIAWRCPCASCMFAQ